MLINQNVNMQRKNRNLSLIIKNSNDLFTEMFIFKYLGNFNWINYKKFAKIMI